VPSRYESLVSAARPNDAHGISLQLVGTDKRVLELGAANGHVTKELKARGNSVVAVEIEEALRGELEAITDSVVITDLDDLDLIDKVAREQFDVVLAGDVLEHTIHTRLILEEIRQLLKPGGYLVISVPNIAHGDVRLALLNGEFRYRDVGILDRTHRTFFTRETLIEFLTANGFHNLEVFASTTPVGTTEIKPDLGSIPGAAIDVVLRDPLSNVYQYVVKATPIEYCSHPQTTQHKNDGLKPSFSGLYETALTARDLALTSLQEELQFNTSQLEHTTTQLEHTTTQLEHTTTQLENSEVDLKEARHTMERVEQQTKEIMVAVTNLSQHVEGLAIKTASEDLAMRDYALGLLAELGETRALLLHKDAALAAANKEVSKTTELLANEMTRAYEAEKQLIKCRAAEYQLNAVYASFTWRLGRFFMLPVRIVRRLLRR